MATTSENLQQVQGPSTDEGKKDYVLKNDSTADDQKPNIVMDNLPRDFDESQQNFLVEGHVESEIEATDEETKIIIKTNNAETTIENSPEACENSPNHMDPLSPGFENQESNISSNNNKDSDENLVEASSRDELPSLIVMGCIKCLLYVMVLRFDPECPKCKNTDLLDVLGDYNNLP